MRVDGLASKVKGAKDAEGIKLVLCPEETAAVYHEEVPPNDDDTIEVREKGERTVHHNECVLV